MHASEVPTLSFLVSMTQRAARKAADIFHQPDLLDLSLKQDGTPVTAGDRSVHESIVGEMTQCFPNIPIIGEEGEHGVHGGMPDQYRLSVDEIDGTGAFACETPVFVTMVALMRGGDVVCSVIHDPILNRTFTAERGKGAHKNGVPIHVCTKIPKYPQTSVATWPNVESPMLVPRMVSGVMRELHDRYHRLTIAWSIGHSDMLVASGLHIGSIFPGNAIHDTAAADLIVREAGGVATDLWGRPLRYDMSTVNGHIFACNERVHAEFVEIVAKHDIRSRHSFP